MLNDWYLFYSYSQRYYLFFNYCNPRNYPYLRAVKIKSQYILRELGDTYIVVVDDRGSSVNLSSVLSFNESAAWLWRQAAGTDFDEASLAAKLCGEYDIEASYAASEVARIVAQWREYGLLEE